MRGTSLVKVFVNKGTFSFTTYLTLLYVLLHQLSLTSQSTTCCSISCDFHHSPLCAAPSVVTDITLPYVLLHQLSLTSLSSTCCSISYHWPHSPLCAALYIYIYIYIYVYLTMAACCRNIEIVLHTTILSYIYIYICVNHMRFPFTIFSLSLIITCITNKTEKN